MIERALKGSAGGEEFYKALTQRDMESGNVHGHNNIINS